MKNVYVIIPNWNGIDWLADCLEAALAQTVPATVVVVDNGSSDGSVELVRSKFPQVKLIVRERNYGFTGGVNPGIELALAAGAEAVALLNNDAIPAPDWLEQLVRTMEADPKIGIVAAKIRHFEDNRLDSTGDFYSVWGFPFPRGRDEEDHGQYDGDDDRNIFAGSGGASLFRAQMLKAIGVFDQRFFAYYEDVDLGFRAQLAGWKVLYAPQAVVRHRIGGTSSRMSGDGQAAAKPVSTGPSAFARYHSVKNFSYLYTKNMPGTLYWKYLPLFWASWAMMAASDAKRGLGGTNLRANITALLHLPGIIRDRGRIQRTRVVSAAHIEQLLYPTLPPLQKLRFARFKRHSH